MEEILASIKRVIREDGRAPAQPRSSKRARADAPPPLASGEDDDVLELDEEVGEPERLISHDAATASRQSLAALSAVHQQGIADGGGPLEAVIRDMLRPMLKDWLDEHLPQIVEALVTREITRITGRNI